MPLRFFEAAGAITSKPFARSAGLSRCAATGHRAAASRRAAKALEPDRAQHDQDEPPHDVLVADAEQRCQIAHRAQVGLRDDYLVLGISRAIQAESPEGPDCRRSTEAARSRRTWGPHRTFAEYILERVRSSDRILVRVGHLHPTRSQTNRA